MKMAVIKVCRVARNHCLGRNAVVKEEADGEDGGSDNDDAPILRMTKLTKTIVPIL